MWLEFQSSTFNKWELLPITSLCCDTLVYRAIWNCTLWMTAMCFIYMITLMTCPSNITRGHGEVWRLGTAKAGYLQEPEGKHAQNLLPSSFNLNYSFANEADVKYQRVACPSNPLWFLLHSPCQPRGGDKLIGWSGLAFSDNTVSAMSVYKENSFNIVDYNVSSGLASHANGKELHLSFYIRAIHGVCSMLTSLTPWRTHRHLWDTGIAHLQFKNSPWKAQSWCESTHRCAGKDEGWITFFRCIRPSISVSVLAKKKIMAKRHMEWN